MIKIRRDGNKSLSCKCVDETLIELFDSVNVGWQKRGSNHSHHPSFSPFSTIKEKSGAELLSHSEVTGAADTKRNHRIKMEGRMEEQKGYQKAVSTWLKVESIPC